MGTKVQPKTAIPTNEGNKISIDSLKIRIPIENVKIINKQLTDYLQPCFLSKETGEIIIKEKEFKRQALKIEYNGIKVHYSIVKIKTQRSNFVKGNSNSGKEYLVVLLPSKVLKEPYFDGITAENIETIYNELMKHKVVNFTLETLLNSSCTDVDFKRDLLIKEEEYNKLLSELRFNTIKSSKLGKGHIPPKKGNGIQWSKREYSTPGNPFIKFYDKKIELNENSHEFANKYLTNINYNDLIRQETTVKNKDHFRKLGIEDTSLESLLNLTDEQKENIMQTALKKQIEPRTRQIKEKVGLSPTETTDYYFLINMLKIGISIETIKYQSTISISHRNSKKDRQNKLQWIYDKHIKENNIYKTDINMANIFKQINWNW